MSAGETPLQDTSVASVRHGLDLFIAVIKKHAFYPEGNAILDQSFDAFRDWLTTFLDQRGSLRLEVEKSRLLYAGEAVQEEKRGERSVIFPLFRDGVQWFEFLSGVSEDELWEFVRLLNRYRELRDESENDLVTALWEADFPRIAHKAVDKFWEAESVISLSGLKPGAGPGDATAGTNRNATTSPSPAGGATGRTGSGPGRGGAGDGAGAGSGTGAPSGAGDGTDKPGGEVERPTESGGISDPTVRMFMAKLERAQSIATESGPSGGSEEELLPGDESGEGGRVWRLTPEEERILADMIAAEENRDTSRDSLNVILALARESLDVSDRAMVQDFVSEEMRQLLGRGDFAFARAFVEQLAAMRESKEPNAFRFAVEVIAKLAGPDVLGALGEALANVRALPNAAADELRRLLLLLPPIVVDALAPMLPRVSEPRVREILMDVVIRQSALSRSDVSRAVAAMPTDLVCELIRGFAPRKLPIPAGLMTALTRYQDPLVREAAAKALLADNPENIRAVFHLLDDRDRNIGLWLLAELGKERNRLAESLLGGYLSDRYNEGDGRNGKFILECYYALGRCASRASVDFLRDVLMERTWRAFFGMERNPHRIGAALALCQMPAEWGAAEVLREAEGSRLVGIRRACEQARGNTRRRKRIAHD